MDINAKFHDEIRKLDVNSHKVSCNYKSWNKEFKEDGKTLARIAEIEKALREKFGRAELVEFYKSNADTTTKFLSAMIWGYEAPAESRKDNRGPSRAKKMLESISASTLLNSVKVDNERRIMAAYKEMDKEIKMCGPSFITKHLYFLGKSSGTATYPPHFRQQSFSWFGKNVANGQRVFGFCINPSG